jgi:diguanylate cyclase (GGDEF)-like protein
MLLSASELQLIVLFATGVATLMSFSFLQMWRSQKALLAGLNWWTCGATCVLVGGIFFALNGIVPELAIIIFGNAAIQFGAVAFYYGISQFYGEPISRWPLFGYAVLMLLMFIFSYFVPDFRIRVMLTTLFIFSIEFAQTRILWARRKIDFGVKLILAGTILRVAVVCYRFLAAPFAASEAGPLSPTVLQMIGIGSTPLWLLAQTIGFILMAEARLRDRLQVMANTDELTGIMSRSAILREAEKQIDLHKKASRPISAIIFDLDHFKQINDRFGHIKGDHVLRDFANKVNASLRSGDLFGRFGGEEFLVILPDTAPATAAALAEQIRSLKPGPELPEWSFSAGVAELDANLEVDQARSLDRLISAADAALYRAKAAGRGCTVVQA